MSDYTNYTADEFRAKDPQAQVTAYLALQRELQKYRQVPDRDQLMAEQRELNHRQHQQFEDFQRTFRRGLEVDRQLAPDGYLNSNERYRWTSGEMNLLIQYVVHQYLPPTNNDGEPIDDQHLHELGWTIINLLDGELDHGVHHRDQVLEEVCKKFGWDTNTDLDWWIRYGNEGLSMTPGGPTPSGQDRAAIYGATRARLQESLDFNLGELRRRLDVRG